MTDRTWLKWLMAGLIFGVLAGQVPYIFEPVQGPQRIPRGHVYEPNGDDCPGDVLAVVVETQYRDGPSTDTLCVPVTTMLEAISRAIEQHETSEVRTAAVYIPVEGWPYDPGKASDTSP